MPRYERNSNIKIAKKEYVVSDLLQPLINYPAEEVKRFFGELNLSIPREVRISVLKEVLRPEVLKTRNERVSLADEMNYRLSWFNQFTEVQLNNLFKFYNNTNLEKEYLEELWLSIIEYITNKSISESDFLRLIDLAKTYSKKEGLVLQDAHKYNETLNNLFFDEKGFIDGLNLNAIRPVLYKSSTITEIRGLGLKYNVDVPKRLRKSELLDIILGELKDRGEYTEQKENDLLKMNIVVMQRFAIKNNIKASTELKKEEVIEYILSNASTTKESYFVPSSSVYEVEAKDLGEEMPVIVPTEVVEDVVVEEEPIVEEEKVVAPLIDEEMLNRLLSANQGTTTTVINHDKETFDYKNVESTHLNIVEYHGKKAKNFSNELNNIHDETEFDTNAKEDKIFQVELISKSEKNEKPFTFGRFLLKLLLNIIVVLLIVLIIVVIYAGVTYKGAPASLKGTEAAIANFFKMSKEPIQAIREFIINLFKLTV